MREVLTWTVWAAEHLAAGLSLDEESGGFWALLSNPWGLLIGMGIGLLLAAVVIGLMRRGSRGRSEFYDRAQVRSSRTLEEVRASLEARLAAQVSEYRSRSDLLRSVAELGRDLSNTPDVDTLMSTAAELIAGYFGVHHAGIYLLDRSGQRPTLRGASSEAGKSLVGRRQRTAAPLGGLVEAVIRQQEPLMLQNGDLGPDGRAPHWLEGTRSQMAAPLWWRDRVIGVLDLQAEEPSAFGDEDAEALEIAAQQVVLAAEVAGTMPITLPSIAELAPRSGVAEAGETTGPTTSPDTQVTGEGRLLVPILLRGQDLGTMAFHREVPAQPWSAEERDLARTMGIQAGLAMERAQLLGENEISAQRESLLRDLAGHLRETDDADQLVQIALGDMSRALDLSVIDVQLGTSGQCEVQGYQAVGGVTQPWHGPMDAIAREAWERDAVVAAQGDVAQAVAVPLRSAGRAIGAMRVERRAALGPWLGEEIVLLHAVADLLLGALDRADALREAREAVERDLALRGVSRRMRQGSEVETVLQAAVRDIRQAMDLHSVSVRLAPLDGDAPGSSAGEGLEAGPEGVRLPEPLSPDSWSVGLQQAWLGHQAATDRIETEEGTALYQCTLPVPGDNRVLGILEVATPVELGDWTPAEMRALEGVAEQLGQALEGARYREGTRRRLLQEYAASEVPNRFYASLDVDAVLQTAVRELQVLLGLDAVEVRLGQGTLVPGAEEPQRSDLSGVGDPREHEDG